MKQAAVIGIAIVFLVILSVFGMSQLGSSENSITSKIESTFTFISSAIDLETRETCTTEFYEEIVPVYSTCSSSRNVVSCLNSSGPDTACSTSEVVSSYQCQTSTQTVSKNKTTCIPNKEFIVEIDDGVSTLKKKIDYSDWGPCIKEIQGDCLVVTCVSLYDGAHNGEFTDCNGGKTCQKFEICEDSVKTYYKNSRDDFVESDPTFYYKTLNVQEVGQ